MYLIFNISNKGDAKNNSSMASMKNLVDGLSIKEINTRLFFLFIFVFQLVFIFQGVELSDEGFIATYYQEIFKNPESVQYNFMFWLTGIIGGLYYKLFPFLGLWGLRLGGVIVTTSTAILVYNLLKKHLNNNYLKLGLFLVVTALNNDIKELNYNNLSAFIYVVVISYLYKGLKGNSNGKFFICGILVGMNVFIRLPNLLGIGLVFAILYYGYIEKNNFKSITKQVLFFLAGTLVSTAAILLLIYFVGHWDIFMNALQVVYKMGKGNQHVELQGSNYGILRLTSQFKSNNGKSIFFALSIFIGFVLGISLFSTIKKKVSGFNRIRKLLKYIFLSSIFILIVEGVIDNYSLLYFYSGVIVIVFALILLTPNDNDTRFLMFCGCFILASYPFGSSAGILTAGRYSFWIGLPIAINYLLNIRSIKNQLIFYRGESENSLQIEITENQIRVLKNIFLVILIFAGLFYSYSYPFFDKRNRLDMRYSIDNKNLVGIYTTKGRAEALNELLHESSKYVKKGDYVLAYDCIPLYNFLTESVPYIRSAYPWLYETEIFRNELDLAKHDKKVLPVVVMQTIKTIGDGSKWPEESLPTDYSKWDVNQGRNKYMNDFLKTNNYKEVWSNHYFKIFVPTQTK
jgi:hypothetical protein